MLNLYRWIVNRYLSDRGRVWLGAAALLVVGGALVVAWHSLNYVIQPTAQATPETIAIERNNMTEAPNHDEESSEPGVQMPVVWGADNAPSDTPAPETITVEQHSANVEVAKAWLAEAFTWTPGEEPPAPWTPNAVNPYDSPWDAGVERANRAFGYAERLTAQLSGLDLLRSTSDRVARRHFTVSVTTSDVTDLSILSGDIWLVSRLTFTPMNLDNPNVIPPITVYSRFQVQHGVVTNALIDSVEVTEQGVES